MDRELDKEVEEVRELRCLDESCCARELAYRGREVVVYRFLQESNLVEGMLVVSGLDMEEVYSLQ